LEVQQPDTAHQADRAQSRKRKRVLSTRLKNAVMTEKLTTYKDLAGELECVCLGQLPLPSSPV
jgi:hypothetical protein